MGAQRWKVVADASQGVPVRSSKDDRADGDATAPAQRLPPGAVVEQLELVGRMLHFRRLSGLGPETGWVSLTDTAGREVLVRARTPGAATSAGSAISSAATAEAARSPEGGAATAAAGGRGRSPASSPGAPFGGGTSAASFAAGGAAGGRRWVVVRCGEEGLVVREGRSLVSREVPQLRLRLGSVVEQLELAGDRLRFAAAGGSGWVSIRHMGRDLLVPEAAVAKASAAAAAGAAEGGVRGGQVDEGAAEDHPLGGWARLAAQYSRPTQQLVAAAASTDAVGGLPPIDELESAPVEVLMEALGFPEEAAREFVKMPRGRKRRIIAESKALMAMPHEKRQDALAQLRKAWPKGPLPNFSSEDLGPDYLLPEGTCFPLSRSFRDPESGVALDWDADGAAAQAARQAFPRRGYAGPEAQKAALRELKCAAPEAAASSEVQPEASARLPNPCRPEHAAPSREQLAGTIMARGHLKAEDVAAYLSREASQRVLLLDGDTAARLAAEDLDEAAFRGEKYKRFKEVVGGQAVNLRGCNELLSVTKANLIVAVHREFLLAGAEIVRTNSLRGQPLALAKYGLHKSAYDLARASAQLAKRATAEVTKQDKRKPRFVAGVLGPPPPPSAGSGAHAWDRLVASYTEQARGLVDGGADLLFIEAVPDARTLRAALAAVAEHFEREGKTPLPLMASSEVAGSAGAEAGRTPAGATVEVFCLGARSAGALSLGFTFSSGNEESLAASAHALGEASAAWCHVCPSLEATGASSSGGANSAEAFAAALVAQCSPLGGGARGATAPWNFVGGGAGALPAHINALARRLHELRARALPAPSAGSALHVSGTEVAALSRSEGLTLIGQRCTPMGSARFRRLVDAFKATGDDAKLRAAVDIAAEQIAKGADILEINLDSDSVDGVPSAGQGALGKFVRFLAMDERVAKCPLMLGSCAWETLEEGLREAPGRCIVNGLCLMLGEEEFLRLARLCRRHGAALVVLAVGDKGQAQTYDEKVRLCQRSYRLLRSRLDFPPQDIIFDCQLMPLGSAEQPGNAVNLINAVAEVRRTCPGASFVAGLGSLSMHFRGSEALRDALHSVFLHHAVPKGLNLAIAEAGALPRYGDLDAELRSLCEELILNRSADGEHLPRFLAFASFRAGNSWCLPVAARPLLDAESMQWMASLGPVSAEGRETQEGIFGKRRPSTPAEQREFWRSQRSSLVCTAQPVTPDPMAAASRSPPSGVRGAARADEVLARVCARQAVQRDEVLRHLNAELGKRVLALDGDIAEALRSRNFAEATYRGDRFPAGVSQRGNEDVLSLTAPEAVAAAHRELLAGAGAEICFTNTFGAHRLRQQRFGAEVLVSEMNRAAARLAKEAAAEASSKDRRPRLVAGVLGPARSSLPRGAGAKAEPDEEALGHAGEWDELVAAYEEQVRALIDGGVDLLLVASARDPLAAKAAVFAAERASEALGRERLPLLLAARVGEDGRCPSGQSLPAFLVGLQHARALAIGLEGPVASPAFRERLRELAGFPAGSFWTFAMSSAGKSGDGGALAAAARDGLLNFVGGAGSAEAARAGTARAPPRAQPSPPLQLSGLEALMLRPEEGVHLVGQRCSAPGSSSFRTLVEAYKYTKRGDGWDAAVQVGASQLASGAALLDVNFDADGLDGKWAMRRFLHACAAAGAPVAAAPIMLSSANWSVVEEGLKHCAGKCIVNALSLAQGEHELLRVAGACLRHGAAVVVMAVAEGGEVCASMEDKVLTCKRAYRLLRSKLDFPAQDIVFDCVVGPLWAEGGAGASAGGAAAFLEAVGELKRSCPGASFVAGLGGLSAPQRGAPRLRQALHSVFLQHAARKGLNLAIADPGRLPRFGDLEAPTLSMCEELVLDSSSDGAHAARFAEFAAFLRGAVADGAAGVAPSLGAGGAELALSPGAEAGALATWIPPPIRPSPTYRRPLETLVQATGTVNASLFATFGSKAHAADNFHRITLASGLKRSVLFSSISAYMGQGGAGPVPGASSFLDGLAMWERHQGLNGQPITVQWGAIGEIGLRRAIYGSRDVFAQFDLGQKLIGPADTQMLERAIMTGAQVPEFLGMAYLDQTWQNTLAGIKEQGGSGLSGRSTFADM